jgi:hypothetical protein
VCHCATHRVRLLPDGSEISGEETWHATCCRRSGASAGCRRLSRRSDVETQVEMETGHGHRCRRSGTGGAATGGKGGTGGVMDGGECTAALVQIGCPDTYRAAIAGVTCPCVLADCLPDRPVVGVCGTLRIFSSGHDGSTTCIHESSTDALVGGVSCGIPGLYTATCPCHNAGLVPDGCPPVVLSACSADAGLD